jgi:hypothetical protein
MLTFRFKNAVLQPIQFTNEINGTKSGRFVPNPLIDPLIFRTLNQRVPGSLVLL